MIHKEGYTIIISTVLILTFINVLAYYFLKKSKRAKIYILMLSIVVLVLFLQFFRNPSRNIIINENNIIAPADGKVVVIENVFEDEFLGEKRKQVSIFMSPINVHVNRYPISGKITYLKYHAGEYLVAWHPKSSKLNERTTIVVENKAGKSLLLRQIAGALARRIVYYGKENEEIIQGEELGFIKFGSRVDIFLPLDAKINVQLDEKVTGGETVIATFN